MDEKELLETAGNQLDRVLGFFSRVDAKASAVLAVDTAMLGFLVTKVPPLKSLQWWEILIPAVTVALLASSFWFLYKGAFPTLKGGNESLVYFREIARRTEAKFVDQFGRQSVADHAHDLLGQAWRNSEILKAKFDHLKIAFVFLALAITPWAFSLLMFTLKAASASSAGTP
jgi:Family of unknown function (DUF5706)